MNVRSAAESYPHVFQPITVGDRRVGNRIVMAPMGNLLHGEDGLATNELVAYLTERGAGGAAVVFAPFVAVAPGHTTFRAHTDDALPGLTRITSGIIAGGALPFLQLAHQGANRATDPVAPSAFPSKFYRGGLPRPMTDGDIAEVTEQFAQAAIRGIRAGFVGIELHAALGYLLASFCSPHANHREDRFGGLDGGLRFLEGIVGAIRAQCGSIPLGAKINAHEHVPDGIGSAGAIRMARALETMGLDFLHIVAASSGTQHCEYCGVSPIYRGDHHIIRASLASQIKEAVRIPVISDGGVSRPEDAEEVLARGWADLVSVGRAFIADPLWLKRVSQGVAFRPCIRCNVCHTRETIEKVPVRCSVNPQAGREFTHPPRRAKRQVRVAVVGGGPGGMMAALSAAQRGHDVVLYEDELSLGGAMRAASTPTFKRPLRLYLDYLFDQIRSASVEVRLGERATAGILTRLGCDAVILAVGSRPIQPEIMGLAGADPQYARSFLTTPADVRAGDEVVVLGASRVGCEVAWYVRDELGARPTLVDVLPLEALMQDEYPRDRGDLLVRVGELGIPLLAQRQAIKVEHNVLTVRREGGDLEQLRFDKLVVAAGAVSDRSLETELQSISPTLPVVCVGDCRQARNIYHALQEGFEAAYMLGKDG